MDRVRSLVRFSLVGALALFLAGFVVPSVSQAGTLTFNLTSNHCTVPADCGAPGTIFGLVTLTQNGANVDVTVDLNSPYVWARTGSVDEMAFKFNATGIVLGDITVDQTFAGQTLAPKTGDFHGDGTGDFAYAIQCTTCGNGISTISSDIVFHVASATIAELTVPNADGIVFVADLGRPSNGATGPIDATTPNPVPEPSTMILYGLGLTMLLVGQKCRKAREINVAE